MGFQATSILPEEYLCPWETWSCSPLCSSLPCNGQIFVWPQGHELHIPETEPFGSFLSRITATVYPQIWFWCQFTEKNKKIKKSRASHQSQNEYESTVPCCCEAGRRNGWSSVSMSASCTAGAANPCSSWSSWGLSVVALWAPRPEGHGPAQVRPGESSEVSGNGAKQALQRGLGWQRMTEEGCGVSLLEGERHRQRRTQWVFMSLVGTEKTVLNSMGKKLHFTH